MPHSQETGEFSAAFTTTQWSEVLDAQRTDPQRARAALENLCERYWYPLYAFIRRRGHAPHDAEDLTQSFFAHLLSRNSLSHVDRTNRFTIQFNTILSGGTWQTLTNNIQGSGPLFSGATLEVFDPINAGGNRFYRLD